MALGAPIVPSPSTSIASAHAPGVPPPAADTAGDPHAAAERGGGVAAAGLAGPESHIEPVRRPRPHGAATRAVHAAPGPDPATGALLTPIYQSTTFRQEAVGVHKGFTYSRAANPTVDALERALGVLEDAPPAVAFATGLAAIHTLLLSVLRAGDHVVVSDVVYGGTVRMLDQILAPLGISTSYVDLTFPERLLQALRPTTRLVLVETPANPTLKLTDLRAVADLTRAAGVRLAVDNTFLTPALLRPLDLGADIAVYSTTKAIEGHNATIGGSLLTRDAALLDRFRLVRKSVGSIQSPFEAWLTIRGIKTLPFRIRRQSRSALQVARFLESHPAVKSVAYPGLPSHPQHALALGQHGAGEDVHGGILAFQVVGGTPGAIAVMNSVRLCGLAENLGAAETLITHPVSMTHGDVPRPRRLAAGITDGLIRLSLGLEDPEDIIDDLDQALAESLAAR